ncbi:Conserved_hypothetical protein [Hexamita inflata]|uniref:Cytochrome b561 domain-containing protein n=1 Tax=Hexamita inflata TaxID=28002 RepID=A0ABP1HUL6_9EUKA
MLQPAIDKENQHIFHQKQNKYIIKYIKGNISSKYLFWHVIFGTILIITCFVITGILSTKFNIMIDTFSTLGSWASWRNPKGWFMFSIGLIVSLFVVLPLIPYQHCRIKYVNKVLSYLVTVSLYLGCLCFLMVAFFPTVRTSISGGKIKFSNVHGISALSGGALFIIGYLMLFIMVLIDKCNKKIVWSGVHSVNDCIGGILYYSINCKRYLDRNLPAKVQKRSLNR